MLPSRAMREIERREVALARYRLFAGLSIDEAARAQGISRATALRDWAYARSSLATALDSVR